MSEKIVVPVLGESITEATVAKWLKNAGDTVEADEPIVELETDKVNLEVPSQNMKVPILLPNIFNHPFTYESDLKLKVGDYVVVPFGKSKITGVVWDEFEKKNNRNFKIKNVLKKLDVSSIKKNNY